MTYIQQPLNSSLCGQSCVAMITDKTLEDIILIFKHKRATRTKELVAALNFLEVQTGDKLIKIRSLSEVSDKCIIKIRWSKKDSHWSVVYNGYVYDPAHGIYPLRLENIQNLQGKVTSYLPVH